MARKYKKTPNQQLGHSAYCNFAKFYLPNCFDRQARYNNWKEEGGKGKGSIIITLEKGG